MSAPSILELRAKISGVQAIARGTAEVRRELQKVRHEQAGLTQSQRTYAVETARAAVRTREYASATNVAANSQKRLETAVRQSGHAISEVTHDRNERRMKSLNVAATAGAASFATMAVAARGGLEAVKKFETVKGFKAALEFNLGKKDSGIVANKTDAVANFLGLDLAETRKQVLSLAATGRIKQQDILGTLMGFTALGQASGASGEGFTRAFEQLTQIAGQGQLQGDELRAIQENGVQLRALLVRAGLGDRIGSQTNPIKWEEIQAAILAFASTAEAQKLLQLRSDQATSSVERLKNEIQTTLLPAIGEGFSPALKGASEGLTDLSRSIDPETVKDWTATIARNAPYIVAFGGAVTLVSKGAMAALSISAWRASKALEQVAANATVSGGGSAGGGGSVGAPSPASGGSGSGPSGKAGAPPPGFYLQPQGAMDAQAAAAVKKAAAQGAKGFRMPGWAAKGLQGLKGAGGIIAGGVGAGLGGAAAGGLVSKVTDNDLAITGASLAGSSLGYAYLPKAGAGLAKFAATKGGAFTGYGLLGAGAILSGARIAEMLAGVGVEDSPMTKRLSKQFGAVDNAGDADEYARVYWAVKAKQIAFQKQFNLSTLPSLGMMRNWNRNDPMIERLLVMMSQQAESRSSGAQSPKQAAMENFLANGSALANRNSQPY